MARRKRKDEAEAGWEPPEFDEVGYMRQEIQGAKAAVVVVLWAVLGAIVSFFLLKINGYLAFFAGLFAFAGLKYVMPILGVRSKILRRRDWAGHAMTYFFSWLAFWIILLNAPFGDYTNPTVQGVVVASYSGDLPSSLVCTHVTGPTTVAMGSNDTLYLRFRTTDNAGVSGSPTVRINSQLYAPAPVTGQDDVCTPGVDANPDGTWALVLPVSSTASLTLDIVAQDAAGNVGRLTVTITAQRG